MKRFYPILILLAAMVSTDVSAQIVLKRGVVSANAANVSGGSIQLKATGGQPGGGVLAGTQEALVGFWYAVRQFIFGNQPPIADAGPDQDLVCPGESIYVTLDGSASTDIDGFIVRYTWSEGETVHATGDAETAEGPTVLLAIGTHTIELEVEDDGGLTATDQVNITVSKDEAAPVIAIATPDDGSYVRGSSVRVTGTVTEQVALQSFTINGRKKTVVGEAPDFTFSASVGGLDEGPNTITAEATDISGNVATPAAITVHRDRTKPLVVIQAPQEGDVFSESPATVSVTGTATDPSPDGVHPGSGVASVKVGSVDAAYDAQTESFAVDTEVRGEGNRRIRVRATDSVGNRTDAFMTVLIDSKPPTLRIASPTNNATVTGTKLTVIGTAHDTGSGIAAVTVNGENATLDGRDFAATLAIAEGVLVVDVVATDNTGKRTTKSLSVNVIGDPTTANTIALRLETSDGAPIAGRRVDLRKVVNGNERGTGLRQNTDVDGRVIFEVDPGLAYRLKVTHSGASYTTDDLAAGADVTIATIPSTVAVLGTTAGEEGVRVDLLKPNGKGSGVRASTDASGVAAFEVLPNTEHSFKVTYAGESLTTSEVTVAEGGSSRIDVQLALVAVEVARFDGTETFAGVRADLLKSGGKGTGIRRLTDDTGTAHFYTLPGATHGVRVSYRGGTYTTPIGTVPATGRSFDVRTAELRLALSGERGDIEGARVDLLKALGKGTGVRDFTDATGFAAFDVLTGEGAIHSLRIRYLGGDYATADVSIPVGAEFHQFDVSTVTSSVLLVGHAGDGIPDARVDLRSGDGRRHGLKAFTGPDGRADFDILPGYDHTFKLYLNGGTWTSGPLADDEDLTVQTHQTQLCLTDAGGDPIAGARVDLLRADGSRAGIRMFTDTLGKAAFDALPDYHVRFKITYHGDSYVTELVPCGELLTLGLDVQASVVSLVLTDSGGGGLEGVRVDLLKSDGRGTGVRANTDDNGFVSFDVVPGAHHRMKVRYHGGQYETSPVAAGDQAAVQTVASTVTFTDTIDVPLDSVRVDLLKASGSGAGTWTRTGRNGTPGVAHFEVLPDQFAHLFKVRFSGGTRVIPDAAPVVVPMGGTNDTPLQTIRSTLTVRDLGVRVEGARVDLRRIKSDGSNTGTSIRRYTNAEGMACFEVLPGFAHLMRVRVDGTDHDTPPLQDVVDISTTLDIGGALPPPPLMKRALAFAPIAFGMEQNHPNPFNPSTVIRYAISEGGHVRLVVYNALGQEVRRLIDREQDPGRYRADWDGRDAAGRQVSSGLYLYRLTAGEKEVMRRMMLTK